MKTLLLGLEEGVEFVAATDRYLLLRTGTGSRFLDAQSAESLRDFLLEHYPLAPGAQDIQKEEP